MALSAEFRAQFDQLIDQVKQQLIGDVNRRIDAQAQSLYELFAAEVKAQNGPVDVPHVPSSATTSDRQLDGEIHRTKSNISLAPSFYRIKSLPSILSCSNFKRQSINCDYDSPHVATTTESSALEKSVQCRSASCPSLFKRESSPEPSKNDESVPPAPSSPPPSSSSLTTPIAAQEPTQRSEPSEPSIKTSDETKDRQFQRKEKTTQHTKIASEAPKRKLNESKPSQRKDSECNSESNSLMSQLNGAEKIYSLDKMKSLLTSSSPVIFVNRVPLSVLSSYDSARSVSEHLASTTFGTESSFLNAFEGERSGDFTPPSSLSRTASQSEEKTNWTSPMPADGSAPDLNSLKKKAIHEMQKSNQYLKFINSHLRNKAHNSDDQHVKSAFDKYGHKLRKQLVKTIESVEQYQIAIGFQQNDSLQVRMNSRATDDQSFFLDIIEKMRKLSSQVHLDMFQLICQEIEACLIEINNKFFVN